MNRGGWLLIGLLFLMGASCTRRDWVGDMLVLTDTTGDVGSNVHIERSGQPHVLADTSAEWDEGHGRDIGRRCPDDSCRS
jgi:hypothetical protein